MDTQKIIIDQSLPASERWKLKGDQVRQIQELVATYVEDMGGVGQFGSDIINYAGSQLKQEYVEELESIVRQCALPLEELLLTNLYYDLFKVVMGCTAFAIDTPNGPIHARNLDWWTKNNLLCTHTAITEYLPGENTYGFKAVGWPGYAAVLSGMAPNRFSITLNAVLSDEPHGVSNSISFLLRTVLATAKDYHSAVEILSKAEIVPDCLLLVSGVNKGEMCVIERTPTKSAIRKPENGFIAVANDYQLINADTSEVQSELQATSCGRFNKISKLISSYQPDSIDSCFYCLSDPEVIMGITVQQMVMSASQSLLEFRPPKTYV